MSVIVDVQHVKKAFGANRIYDDLSLQIEKGETLTILGASGSGKSVLLKLIIGLMDPDEGAILIDGTDIVPMNEEERVPVRQRVSMLFQGGALFDSLTVGDNVAYPMRRQPKRFPESEIDDRVQRALKMVGLPDVEMQTPGELSGGMKKRVALARAISAEPEVVLYDEPTTGLDPLNTRRISDLIRQVQQELHLTSIVVTHDLPSAYLVSDRMAMLHGRKIIAVEEMEAFKRSRQEAIREFVTAMEVPENG